MVSGAALRYRGGHIRVARVVPARLRYKGGMVTFAGETSTGAGLGVLNLDRLGFADKLPGEDDMNFMRRAAIWESNSDAIEEAFTAINKRVDELAAILARLTAAEELAQAARDEAMNAAATVSVVQGAVSETFRAIDPTYGGIFDNQVNLQ